MRIATLRLQTARPDALSRFYGERFGFDVATSASGAVTVPVGETTIEFGPAPPGVDPTYHVALDVPSNRFDEAVAWLSERTALLSDPETGEETFAFDFMDARAVYCLDPVGNVVELVAREALPRADRAFDSDSLRHVSEVGLPTPNVPETVERLEDVTGATRWPESTDEFAVVGADDGMFIVVETGRAWLPTDEPAVDTYPITVATPEASSAYEFETLPYRIEPK